MKPVERTILIVDDDATLRRALESALTPLGYRVLSTGTADAAYELVAREALDAVLLDVHLQSMSGLALYLAIVYRWPALAGRIAIMTGDPTAPDVRPWLQAQRCPVLTKPFRPEALLGWLETTLRSRDRTAADG